MTKVSMPDSTSSTSQCTRVTAYTLSRARMMYSLMLENGVFIALIIFGSALAGLLRRMFIGHNLCVQSGSFIRGVSHISVGKNFRAGKGLWLQAVTTYNNSLFSPRIVIGENVNISFWVHIAAVSSIKIGNNVLIGSRVVITDHNHGAYGPDEHSSPLTPPYLRPLVARPIRIGSNVWIGDGVSIIAGSDIGEGCIIGANAVVTGRIPPFCIAIGSPAKPIKRYDFEKQKWLKCGGSHEEIPHSEFEENSK